MKRASIAIRAAVLAASVWIDARLEAYVRTGIVGKNAPAIIPEILRRYRGILAVIILRIPLHTDRLETIGRIGLAATAVVAPWTAAVIGWCVDVLHDAIIRQTGATGKHEA